MNPILIACIAVLAYTWFQGTAQLALRKSFNLGFTAHLVMLYAWFYYLDRVVKPNATQMNDISVVTIATMSLVTIFLGLDLVEKRSGYGCVMMIMAVLILGWSIFLHYHGEGLLPANLPTAPGNSPHPALALMGTAIITAFLLWLRGPGENKREWLLSGLLIGAVTLFILI